MFFLFNCIIAFILALIEWLTIGNNDESILVNIYQLGIAIPSIAVGIRRMHDTGKSGWFLIIPIYNFILAVTKGDSQPNNYGEIPE